MTPESAKAALSLSGTSSSHWKNASSFGSFNDSHLSGSRKSVIRGDTATREAISSISRMALGTSGTTAFTTRSICRSHGGLKRASMSRKKEDGSNRLIGNFLERGASFNCAIADDQVDHSPRNFSCHVHCVTALKQRDAPDSARRCNALHGAGPSFRLGYNDVRLLHDVRADRRGEPREFYYAPFVDGVGAHLVVIVLGEE